MSDTNITKNALARALKKLMAEKNFQKISVTDICDKCGMNRKSFYYHFKDKFDLMNWIFYTDFITMVTTRKIQNGWDLLENVMEMFYNDKDFYKSALNTEGQNSFSEYFHESMIPIITYMFMEEFDSDDDIEMLMSICADTCLVASKHWIDGGCVSTPGEYVELIKSLLSKIAVTIK